MQPTPDTDPHKSAAVLVEGSYAGQYWEGRNTPGSPNRVGNRVWAGPDWMEVELDPARYPAGPVVVRGLARRADPAAVPLGYVTDVSETVITGTGPTVAAPTTVLPPCFRDPATGQPRFLRVAFGLPLHEVLQRPGMRDAVRAVGFNCLFSGVLMNTARGRTTPVPDAEFLESQRVFLGTSYWNEVVRDLPDLMILGAGDDFVQKFQGQSSIHDLSKVSDAALVETIRRAKATGRLVAVDLCDEVPFHLGDPPTDDLRAAAGRMARLFREAGVLAAYCSGPNIGPDSGPRWYEGAEYSAYHTFGLDSSDPLFFHPAGLGRGGLWAVPGVDQLLTAIERIAANRHTRTDCPRLFNVSACGGHLIPPHLLLAQIGGAVCAGASGIKVYQVDTLGWKANRAINPYDQIGTDPDTNPDRWAAMGHAFAAIQEHEDRILQWATPVQHTLGRWWMTRETHGPAGRFWLAVNRLEGPQPVPPVPTWATRVEAVTPTGRVVNPTTIPAGSWVIATD